MNNNLNSHVDLNKSSGCFLCPRKCGALRVDEKSFGVCRVPNEILISKYGLHFWEEPCLSGKNGSGTIFFYGCPLGCIYCQNIKISRPSSMEYLKNKYSIEKLKDIILELQSKGANNINFVTGTQYIPQIASAINLARNDGLNIPTVWNTSGYEDVESLKLLKDVIDIYLTDFRYYDDTLAKSFSNAGNYKEVAISAIDFMVESAGDAIFAKERGSDDNQIMQRGVIVRVLLFPSHVKDSKDIVKYVYNNYKDKVYISLLSQYTPIKSDFKFEELNRKVTGREYDRLVNYALGLNIKNCFIQDIESASAKFIPDFK